MISDKQLEANRQNALQSTGPTTVDGVDAIKLNALRHGLRSVQTVVPGEDPDAWEAHRAAAVEDVKPVGVLELALAEQIAEQALATWACHSDRNEFDWQRSRSRSEREPAREAPQTRSNNRRLATHQLDDRGATRTPDRRIFRQRAGRYPPVSRAGPRIAPP